MSQEEATAIINKLKEHTVENTSSVAKARAALVAAGLLKEDGSPETPYV